MIYASMRCENLDFFIHTTFGKCFPEIWGIALFATPFVTTTIILTFHCILHQLLLFGICEADHGRWSPDRLSRRITALAMADCRDRDIPRKPTTSDGSGAWDVALPGRSRRGVAA